MSQQTVSALTQVGQVAITVRDLSRAVTFYKDTLGLAFLFQVPGMAFFQCGSVRLMMSLPEGPDGPTYSSILYYKVADIQQVHESLASRNVQIQRAPALIAPMPDHDLWMSFYRDSEENTFALMSEVPRT